MYIEQGTASRTLTQAFNRNKEPPCGPCFQCTMLRMQRNFGSRLKPMTRKHLATSKTSTRAIPKRQERSRRTDISILLVLREKEVRYCLREGQPAVCHQCVEVYQTVRRGQPHESTKARLRRATTSSRYTVSSIPKPHAVVVVVVVVVAVVVVAVVVVV